MERAALFGMDLPELEGRLGVFARKAPEFYRALYRQRATSIEHIPGLPQELTAELRARGFVVGHPEIIQTATSTDGTERYLVRMSDGRDGVDAGLWAQKAVWQGRRPGRKDRSEEPGIFGGLRL